MRNYRSPNGHDIIGNYEYIPCTCPIDGISDDGVPEYSGEKADMHWDDSRQVERNGKGLFVCARGDLWTFDQLTVISSL